MKAQDVIVFLMIVTIAVTIISCGLLNEKNKNESFEAGPILFIYEGNLWSMEEDGSDAKQLTHYENQDFSIGDARWSPDGSKIAVTGPADLGNPEEWAGAIYIMNADGTGRYKLTNPPLEWFRYVGDLARKMAWSPDGNKIAFSRMRPPEALGMFDVFVANIETGKEIIVSQTNLVEYVDDWYPETGELLINYFDYSSRDSNGITNGRAQLGFMNLDGEYVDTLGKPENHYSVGRISPDGSKLAYTKNNKLYMFDYEANLESLLFDEAEFQYANAWSSTNNKIVFQTYTNSGEDLEIYIIDIKTKETINITPFPSPESWIWVSSWRRR